MTETKYCKRCDTTKPITEFSIDRKRPDGLNFYCKECCNKMGKKHRKTALGIYNNTKGKQKWCKKNGDYRAKPFKIQKKVFVDWFKSQPRVCGYCDIPEEFIKEFKKVYGGRSGRLTVDCMDNRKGYVHGNLILACDKCNVTKSNLFTYAEMRDIAQRHIKPKWEKLLREQS